MQFTQNFTFPSSPVASGSSNDWSARPTQAVNNNAVPVFGPFGPAALAASHPYTTNGYDFPGPKSNEAEPAHGLIPGPRADENGKMAALDDLAFLDHPHTPPTPAPANPFPAAGPVLKLCGRCLSGCTAEDGPKACPIAHAPPIEAWITSGRVNYPVHYYPCCDTYRLAIPGLRLRRPFNPVCRWGPHIPAD